MVKKHILIIGRSPDALDGMRSMLEQKGHTVETTHDFDNIPDRYRLEDFDLITMGGKVSPETKEHIMTAATARKNTMQFVQGMAGIPGLVVDQIEGELAADLRDSAHAPTFQASTRTFTLSLPKPSRVLTFIPPNPGSDSHVLCNEILAAGTHTVSVPADIPMQSSFASIRVDDAVYCFNLSTA